MGDKAWECWLHRCLRRRETQVQHPSRIDHSNRENSVSSSSYVPATGKPVAMYSHRRKSSRDPKSLQEPHSERGRIFAEHREVRDYLELRADKAAQGEKAALSKLLSEAEYDMRLLFEDQRSHILPEARSEMHVQDFLKKSADKALRESNRQVHCHRMELYQANQAYENSRREQILLQAELENRERAVQETRVSTHQEMEELKKCCA